MKSNMAKTSSLAKAWKLSSGREFFEIIVDGNASRWEYDVVEIKLLAEEVERDCGMRIDDKPEVSRPTPEFLAGFAALLSQRGCTGCTSDAAYRVYNVVNTQFAVMTRELNSQITAIAKG